ncbi:MAG: 23S rRNA (adenine(2503)-C(2))-methyltransferase RlmN [bacterium]|nr:23S rRNA (adenine(2503)-C(2))-methyltransferase RlmN [bacterium]
MNLEKLEKIFESEKPFRLKQAKQAIFRDLIEVWDEATTLPLVLREQLKKEVPLSIEAEISTSADGKTSKALICLEDKEELEAVLMRHDGRNTVCVSSQVGCPLGCVFCATGQMGFIRDLTAGEIVAQVLFWARWLKKNPPSHSEGEARPLRLVEGEARRISRSFPPRLALLVDARPGAIAQDDKKEKQNDKNSVNVNRVNNVVFMGMGEPFLNYDNVFEAIKILNDDNLLGIGARHISISTVGIIEGIERMALDMPQINLAISLHAPDDALRQKLMPIDKKYPLEAIIAVAKDYVAKTNRKLMFEYIMIRGVNDSQEQARQLVNLLDDRLFFVNLIAYNPTGGLAPLQNLQNNHDEAKESKKDFAMGLEPSLPAQIKKFKDILEKSGIQALQRYRFGQDVRGACGQLASSRKVAKVMNGDN